MAKNICILPNLSSPTGCKARLHPALFLRLVIGVFTLVSANLAFGKLDAPPPDDHGNDKSTVSLTKITDLCFGAIFIGSTGGTITVKPDGTTIQAGGAFSAHVPGGNAQTALFQLNIHNSKHQNDDSYEYEKQESDDENRDDNSCNFTRDGCLITISLPKSATLVRDHGMETMKCDNFTISRTMGSINIGATLHIDALQVPGTYHGTYNVTVICE